MTILVLIMLGLVAVGGTIVTCTADPSRQAVILSVYGVLLSVLFLALAAPDVALSQVAIGSAVVPLMVLLTVRTVRSAGHRRRSETKTPTSGGRR